MSNPSSIAVSFTTQRKATVELNGGRLVDRNIPARSFGLAGPTPISWMRVREPSECIEVTLSAALRRQLAEELRVASCADLDDVYGRIDPAVWVTMARLRSLVRHGVPDPLAIEAHVHFLYRRVLKLRYGAHEPVRGDGAFSPARLRLVADWIEANLDRSFTIVQLASVAALTTSHFIRSFKRSIGVSPYQYVRARRLERAREQLADGNGFAAVSARAGFASHSQFRGAFRRHFGYTPMTTLRRGKRHWIHPGALDS